MAYGGFKYLARRTVFDKMLSDKAFNIAKNPKYDWYQRGIASVVYKFFDKKFTGCSGNTHANKSTFNNEKLSEELHKPIIKKFKKEQFILDLKKICDADLDDMQLISKFSKGFRFLLWVIDIFSKYAWVVPLKDKQGISIVNAFEKILKESNRSKAKFKGRKPNKMWVDKGNEFYNNSF